MWSPYAEPSPWTPYAEPVLVSSPYRVPPESPYGEVEDPYGHRSGLYGLSWFETVGRVVRPTMRARTGSRWLVRVRRSRMGMSRPCRRAPSLSLGYVPVRVIGARMGIQRLLQCPYGFAGRSGLVCVPVRAFPIRNGQSRARTGISDPGWELLKRARAGAWFVANYKD